MSPTNTLFTVVSALCLPLVCVPLYWHLEAWNTGTCLFMIWTAIGLFVTCVNSIIWRNDALIHVPVWCDITTRLMVGWTVGIPAASLCINRRLYLISTVQSLTWSKAEKIRAVVVDLAIGILFPALVMALYYIPQGHRFNILEEIGCVATSASTWVSLILFLPPFILMLISLTYSVRSLLQLRKTQRELSQVLSSNSSLTAARFYRLMALAGAEIFIGLPFQIVTITFQHFGPWISWEYTHANFGRIVQIPSVLWRGTPEEPNVEFSRWSLVVCAIVFFMFFGFAEEARKSYRIAISSISKRVGISTTNSFGPGHKFGSVTSSVGQFKISSMVDKSRSNGSAVISKEISEKRQSTISFTTVGDTEVGTLRTPSSSSLNKSPLVRDDPKSPSSPSFRLSVPLAADEESFLEFSNNEKSAPGNIHRI